MIFTDDVLKDISDKMKVSKEYSKWYYGYSEEIKDFELAFSERIKTRSDRIGSCMDLWQWDMYENNKLLDLKKVNRCMNNRFCPNCRKLDLACTIHNFRMPFNELLAKGYYPYLVTLTVKNCKGKDLRSTIDHMNKSFRKFYNALSYSLTGVTTKGFKGRLIDFDAALKVLEITFNKKTREFHPHFHVMFFSSSYDEDLMRKTVKGAYSTKRKKHLYHSELDFHLSKIWTICCNGTRLSQKNYDLFPNNNSMKDLLMVDIKEMDDKGIYEILKYTFKDSDISSYYVFKNLVVALENKRIRQGYGLLHGLKCENETEGDIQELEEFLEIDKKETPQQLLTKELNTLIKVYHGYTKISRFKAYNELSNISQ